MRKLLVVAAVAFFAVPAFAQVKGAGKYGTAGCGLGSMIFADQPGMVQIFAATTNGTFANQTFGITSGTLNCGSGMMAMGTKNFVDANREALAKDISRGQGEAIGALTVINACEDSSKVGAALQAQFKSIFPTAQATNDEVTAAILKTLTDPAVGCGKISISGGSTPPSWY
ncbi:MAG: DUF3015 family protein [Anaeromyxobacteraceae bacterium]